MITERTPTEQQRKAAQTRHCSVVLSSGAGCGKTSVLTDRYLSHLEKGEADVGRLVAITFTERAAREMRKRIRATIEARIATSTGDERERWRTQLVDLETATIGTIHSFCTTLLRRHALAIGLDPSFHVLEPAIAANLRTKAVREALMELVLDNGTAGKALRNLIELYGYAATRHIVAELADVYECASDLSGTAQILAKRWTDAATGKLLQQLVDYLTSAATSVSRTLRLLRQHPCTGPKMQARVEVLLSELPALAKSRNLATAVETVCSAAKVQSTEGVKAWPSSEVYEQIKEALEDLRKDLPKRLSLFLDDPGQITEATEVGLQFIQVADVCRTAYARSKERAGGLDFNDLLVYTRDLLRDRAAVRHACHNRIQFLLVDELQDTDPVQMEIVKYLCNNNVTNGKLFAVGDAKQSIYRFRGAEVALFEQLRGDIPKPGQQLLTVNFRSQPPILDFTNALLCQHIEPYEPLEAALPRAGTHPCVEFLWGREVKPVEASRQLEAKRIAQRIAAMVADKERLTVERPKGKKPVLRPVQQGDVVLLFRAMTNVGIYENALREAGLDYYVVGGRAFYAQQEIYDLANLLRTLENPNHSIALAGVLRSSFGCLSDDALVLLTTHPKGLWAGLHDPATRDRLPADDRAAAERIGRWLTNWRQLKDRLPTSRLLQRVIGDSGFDASLRFEFLGERKLANLWKLIEHARAFDAPGRRGLSDFLLELERLLEAQPREEQAATVPEESDVVRIMSIHQAKGLEFPVVFLPDLTGKPRGPEGKICIWDRKLGPIAKPPADEDPAPFSDYACKLWRTQETIADWHEDLRTLYVACTRAKDYLVLSGSLPEPFAPLNNIMAVLSERFDLKTGRCCDETATNAPQIAIVPIDTAVRQVRASRQDKPTRLTKKDAAAVAKLPATEPTDAQDPTPIALTRIRSVLAQWDFRDPNGWRGPLAVLLDQSPANLTGGLAKGFERFAGSDLYRQLADAQVCHRVIDIAMALPNGAFHKSVIDLLWQNDKGWNVAVIATTDADRRDEVAMQTPAVEARLGNPVIANVYDWSSGAYRL